MQNVKSIILICTLFFLSFSCNSKSEKKAGNSEKSDSFGIGASDQSDFIDEASIAICLWPKVGLRDKPGRKDTKYLTTIYFGETVALLDEKKKAEDDKEYLKVRLSDGSEGWVYSIFLRLA